MFESLVSLLSPFWIPFLSLSNSLKALIFKKNQLTFFSILHKFDMFDKLTNPQLRRLPSGPAYLPVPAPHQGSPSQGLREVQHGRCHLSWDAGSLQLARSEISPSQTESFQGHHSYQASQASRPGTYNLSYSRCWHSWLHLANYSKVSQSYG